MNAFQNIMRSAILILKSIHDKCVVHRDLKPANWMIRDDELVLIDFGLATFYMDAEERHIPPSRKHHIIGTPKYASWNVLGGEEYSRRDDIMSIAYIGLFLMEGSDLWTDFEQPDANRERLSRSPEKCSNEAGIDKTHIMHPINQWFLVKKTLANVVEQSRGWPALQEFIKRIYALSFQERPDYDQYVELFVAGKTI
jgi:casein kinase 1